MLNIIKNEKKIKVICFDIDNTICRTNGSNYKNSKPIIKNIKYINHLYNKGYYKDYYS